MIYERQIQAKDSRTFVFVFGKIAQVCAIIVYLSNSRWSRVTFLPCLSKVFAFCLCLKFFFLLCRKLIFQIDIMWVTTKEIKAGHVRTKIYQVLSFTVTSMEPRWWLSEPWPEAFRLQAPMKIGYSTCSVNRDAAGSIPAGAIPMLFYWKCESTYVLLSRLYWHQTFLIL